MSDKELKEVIEQELHTKVNIQGSHGGGCINEAVTITTDNGDRIFVKINKKLEARAMFDGEFVSLDVIHAMDVVRVPKPIKVIDLPSGGAAFLMECLDIHGLSKYSAKLGEQLARLHLLNAELEEKAKHGEKFVGRSQYYKYVDKFGFYTDTCCGYLKQDNTWKDTWLELYARKIDLQMELLNKNYRNNEARELWSQLLPKLSKFFEGLEIKPALIHGDLWGGNVGETSSEPVIFDPASYYGHSEFDLSISKMFGGFGSSFFDSYHKLIPQAEGFRKRVDLYKLFHYLNHWNHFGSGYEGSTLSTLRTVLQYVYP